MHWRVYEQCLQKFLSHLRFDKRNSFEAARRWYRCGGGGGGSSSGGIGGGGGSDD